MTRQECENAIFEKMLEIVKIYHGYHPNGQYLTLTFMGNHSKTWVGFNNSYWSGGEDEEIQISFAETRNEEESA